MAKKWWQRGQKASLARAIGVSRGYLCDIVAGHRGVSHEMSMRLESGAARLGLDIPWDCWIGHIAHPALSRRRA